VYYRLVITLINVRPWASWMYWAGTTWPLDESTKSGVNEYGRFEVYTV